MTMHMYVWSRSPFFHAVAQASSAADARRLILAQIGDADDSSREARRWVEENTPAIWHGPNSEFALTDSAELQEQEKCNDDLRSQNSELQKRIAGLEGIWTKPTAESEAIVVTNILRHWEPWRTKRFAEHLSSSSERIAELEAAIRKHRDQRGDDRCWLDDRELYAVLPEGVGNADLHLDEPAEMLENCKRFISSRRDPNQPYVSPQRRIEELEDAIRSVLMQGAHCPFCEEFVNSRDPRIHPPKPHAKDCIWFELITRKFSNLEGGEAVRT